MDRGRPVSVIPSAPGSLLNMLELKCLVVQFALKKLAQ